MKRYMKLKIVVEIELFVNINATQESMTLFQYYLKMKKYNSYLWVLRVIIRKKLE